MSYDLDEELKALLEAANRPITQGERVKPLNETEAWLAAIGAKSGVYPFTATQLWLQYKKWSKAPIKQFHFFVQLKDALFHLRKISKQTTIYSLDPSSFDISEEAIRELNIQLRHLDKIRKNGKKKNL